MDNPNLLDSSNPPSTITIALPKEFATLCQRDNLTPEVVLRCFIADLCGIVDYAANPRRDGYDSDERELAQAYYYRLGFLRGFGFDQ